MSMPVNSVQSNLLNKAISQRLQQNSTNKISGRKEDNKQDNLSLNGANNPGFQPTDSFVRTSIFYINDYHGKSINMERTMTASNAFDAFVPSTPTDKLKLSSGDIMLGEIMKANQVAVQAQKAMGIMASAMGNHEYDMPKHIGELIPNIGFKLLACNVNIKPDNPLSKKVEKSYVQDVNGHKYGIIGASPVDLFMRLKYGKIFDELNVDDIDKTIQDIQAEVDKLKSQGIDKIILLSHVGYGYDKQIARETDGIDVILGGHSHNLITDVKDGVNLFKSKSGEPVVVTQAGRDGKNFGILNLEFNNKGVLTKIQNNVANTRKFKRNAPIRYVFEQILGKPKVIGKINSAPPPLTNDLIEPSGHANFLTDCMRAELGTDIAMFGAATIRGYFEAGNIDTRSIEDLSPFKNKMVVVKYNQKDIVDALKLAAKSMVSINNKPGLIHVSGLKYTVSKDGNLRSLTFVDKNGQETPIDINNPDTTKYYRVAITDYYAAGNDGFASLNRIKDAETKYDFDVSQCIEDYIQKHKEPIDIVDDGRIQIVD